MNAAILALVAIGIVVYPIDTIAPRYSPGVLIPEETYQQLTNGTRMWKMGKYQVTALAAYEIRARSLHTESYWLDHGAPICHPLISQSAGDECGRRPKCIRARSERPVSLPAR